uniref:Bm14717, isoform a n=1 Tax=Brugia malayi TaxID=6279 RepID=A8PYJ2_BRUMA
MEDLFRGFITIHSTGICVRVWWFLLVAFFSYELLATNGIFCDLPPVKGFPPNEFLRSFEKWIICLRDNLTTLRI